MSARNVFSYSASNGTLMKTSEGAVRARAK
jgi:hypothetical protein